MQDLDLTGRELGVLRALMAMEPAPGQPLPEPVVLERIQPWSRATGWTSATST